MRCTFQELFGADPYLEVQESVGESSWFEFSLALREVAPFSREELVVALHLSGIEHRPIVSGNFLPQERTGPNFLRLRGTDQVTNAGYIDSHGSVPGSIKSRWKLGSGHFDPV